MFFFYLIWLIDLSIVHHMVPSEYGLKKTLNNNIQDGYVTVHDVPFNIFTNTFQSNLPEEKG